MTDKSDDGQRQKTVFHGCDLRFVLAEPFRRDDGSTGIPASCSGQQTATDTLSDATVVTVFEGIDDQGRQKQQRAPPEQSFFQKKCFFLLYVYTYSTLSLFKPNTPVILKGKSTRSWVLMYFTQRGSYNETKN